MNHSTPRQHWISTLAHSQPAELAARWQQLQLQPDYQLIRPAEIGLTRLQSPARWCS
jgi:alpha-D-ribose 1-methylphosphonate 5-triphosphate synthase subunit PhnG